jgi:hypothetical protein
MHIRKLLHIIYDLQSSKGVTSLNPNPYVPGAFIEDLEESGGVWAIEDGLPALLEDFNGMEFVFVAEMADTEALKPYILARQGNIPNGHIGRRQSWRS